MGILCLHLNIYVVFVKYVKYILTHYYIVAILPIVTREEIKMMYIYDPEKIDELLEKIKDDDSVTLTGSQLRELAEKARVALWHDVFVFMPEVEHVAQQIHRGGLRLNLIEKAHETAFLSARMLSCERAEVGVGEKIYRPSPLPLP